MTEQRRPVTLVADGLVRDGTTTAPGWVRVEDGIISATGLGTPPAGPGEVVTVSGTIAPGLIDIHHHGALGHDYGAGTAADARTIVSHHRGTGATHLVASVATLPLDVMAERVEILAGLTEAGEIAGIHLEGPYLAEGHRGCHAPELLRVPTVAELRELVARGRGALRMVTLAPELPGALEAIRFLVDEGVVVAVGHTSCTAEEARAAFDAGATVLTHAYNGMPPLHHREPGPLGAALFDERVSIELILDGIHVAPEPARVLAQMVPDRLVLISDAMAATGLGDGTYEIGATQVRVQDGVARAVSNGSLAGSTITLADALAAAVDVLGMDLAAAVACVTTNPAVAVGLPVPRLAAGARADLVVLEGGRPVRVMKDGLFIS